MQAGATASTIANGCYGLKKNKEMNMDIVTFFILVLVFVAIFIIFDIFAPDDEERDK
jgi:hypothetical protein